MRLSERAKSISGAVPIIPVPFDLKEAVDESALQRLIDFSVECRVNAVCLPAYGSEFYKLSEKERVRVVEIAAKRAVGRIQVVAQCNHGSSRNPNTLLTRRKIHFHHGPQISPFLPILQQTTRGCHHLNSRSHLHFYNR